MGFTFTLHIILAARRAVEIKIFTGCQRRAFTCADVAGGNSQIVARLHRHIAACGDLAADCGDGGCAGWVNFLPAVSEAGLCAASDVLVPGDSNIIPGVQQQIATRFEVSAGDGNIVARLKAQRIQ